MPVLPQIDPATATGEAATLFADVQRALGLVPNMTKAMANSPALLRGYLGLSGALGAGVIPAGVREQLAIVTAEYNACTYCLSAHTYIGGELLKVSPEELESARRAESADPHNAALLALAHAILRGRGRVDDGAVATARAAGVSDAEIAEVVGHVALNVLTNYFNTLADVDVDWPVVQPYAYAG